MREPAAVSPGALLIRDGFVETVGTSDEIEKQLDDNCTIVDAGGRVVVPGLVAAHTYPAFGRTRVDEFEERRLAQPIRDRCS